MVRFAACEEVATFIGISILAAMALQWPMGYLSDLLPRRLVIVVAAGAAVFGHRSEPYLYVGVALLYGLAACIYPLCLALTHDMLSKTQIVRRQAQAVLQAALIWRSNAMSKRIASLLAALLVASCASTTLRSAWYDTSFTGGPFKRILVVGVGTSVSETRLFEDIFSQQLTAAGTQAVPCHQF